MVRKLKCNFYIIQQSKKSFDVYIDKNPDDKYLLNTPLSKMLNHQLIVRLYKSNKYPHKRIWQVGMIMYVRLKVLKEEPKEFKLSKIL